MKKFRTVYKVDLQKIFDNALNKNSRVSMCLQVLNKTDTDFHVIKSRFS
jgi:ADP-glucose pyrophosphorylase